MKELWALGTGLRATSTGNGPWAMDYGLLSCTVHRTVAGSTSGRCCKRLDGWNMLAHAGPGARGSFVSRGDRAQRAGSGLVTMGRIGEELLLRRV
jgi:hypothetical protein